MSEGHESLERNVRQAWSDFSDDLYLKIQPRFYKEKKGRKKELINPWKNLQERIEAENHSHELYLAFNKLYMEYFKATGERLEIYSLWKEIDTPDGIRH